MDTLIFDLSEVLIAGLDCIEKPLASRLRADEQAVLAALGGQPLQDLFCGTMTEDKYLSVITRREQWDIAPEEIKLIIRENFRHRVPGMVML